ncbi:hypothetical protein [Luteolibacter soli]|uniref:Uncharacterized protein n=1 Tax=Luteolibacter soli TaxID=3135280 RepID=A0ABU9AWN2_9BACT
MMPTVIFATTGFGLSLLGSGSVLRQGMLDYGMLACILVTLVSAIAIGSLDARLRCQQRKVKLDAPRANLAVETFNFVVAQVFVIPGLLFLYMVFAGLVFHLVR